MQPRRMPALCVLALVFLLARIPLNDDAQEIAEELRRVAIRAGCQRPVVAMRWPAGEERLLQIEVTCPEEAKE